MTGRLASSWSPRWSTFPCAWISHRARIPSIVSAEGRRRAFGEPDHRRVYGADLVSRLEDVGLDVVTYRATDLPADTVTVNGLSRDEHIFFCRRPAADGRTP